MVLSKTVWDLSFGLLSNRFCLDIFLILSIYMGKNYILFFTKEKLEIRNQYILGLVEFK